MCGVDFLAAGGGNGKVVLLEANPEPSRELFPDPIVVGPDGLDGPGAAPSRTHSVTQTVLYDRGYSYAVSI